MNSHLRKMGIRTIGHLANIKPEVLTKRWGIPGQVLWLTANGIDDSPVSTGSHGGQKAIGHAMTLPRDYRDFDREISVVLLELCEEVCARARSNGVMGYTVSANCRGADFDNPTGFNRQHTLPDPTNCTMDVFQVVCDLFHKFWDPIYAVIASGN